MGIEKSGPQNLSFLCNIIRKEKLIAGEVNGNLFLGVINSNNKERLKVRIIFFFFPHPKNP